MLCPLPAIRKARVGTLELSAQRTLVCTSRKVGPSAGEPFDAVETLSDQPPAKDRKATSSL